MTKLQKTFVAMAAFALILIATACVPPNPGPGHGKASFDYWANTNVTIVYNHDLSGIPGRPCGWTDDARKTVYIDNACLQRLGDPSGARTQATLYHELAHLYDHHRLGFSRPRGELQTAFDGTQAFPGIEEGAQCVEKAVIGYNVIPAGWDQATILRLGYWSCPEPELTRIRDAMLYLGDL